MKIWVFIFILMIISITIVTFYKLSLYWCLLPILVICLFYWYISDSHSKVRKPIKKLPYGILFFGMSFFIFVEAFSGTPMFSNIVDLISGFETNQLFPISLLGSGIVVNIFNDLPASALIAQILSEINFETKLIEIVTYQATLSGLNIGKYLTQIGALAGILWFSVISIENKKQKKRYGTKKDKKLPKRTDLVKYGAVNFVVNSIALILFFISLLYLFGV